MACYHPIKADYIFRSDGKKQIYFSRAPVGAIPISIPCGQCSGCRFEYSRQWAIRCMLEAQQWEYNFFLTLTYDNEHLPCNDIPIIDSSTGEYFGVEKRPTLVKHDMVKFMKDLRRYYAQHYKHDNIRFYDCGEYGDKNGRPHYHAIIFNLPIPDLKVFSQASKKYGTQLLFESAIISKIWKKGIVAIGEVNFSSASYVARYMMKKQKGATKDLYVNQGIADVFCNMSRMPGIGYQFYQEHNLDIYNLDELVIIGANGKPISTRPPKYFDRLYDIDNSVNLSQIKENRRVYAEKKLKKALEATSLNEDEYLAVQEGNFYKKLSCLTRQV